MTFSKYLIATAVMLLASLAQAERLKDLASIQGVRSNQLIGYGLVVGLNGSRGRPSTSRCPPSVTLRACVAAVC